METLINLLQAREDAQRKAIELGHESPTSASLEDETLREIVTKVFKKGLALRPNGASTGSGAQAPNLNGERTQGTSSRETITLDQPQIPDRKTTGPSSHVVGGICPITEFSTRIQQFPSAERQGNSKSREGAEEPGASGGGGQEEASGSGTQGEGRERETGEREGEGGERERGDSETSQGDGREREGGESEGSQEERRGSQEEGGRAETTDEQSPRSRMSIPLPVAASLTLLHSGANDSRVLC